MMKTKLNGLLALAIMLIAQISFAQTKTISGVVSDESGPLPGVSILIKGTGSGTETDFDGNYTIQANVGDVLQFSFVGMTTQEITVGNSNTIDVILEGDNLLDEVIVTAYGTTTKEAFTGSAETIGSEELQLRTVTSPIAAIEGTATGVQVVSASGQPGSSPGIIIRGVGTLNGSTRPLYIVDGIQFEGDLSSLNQDDIENMTILKDAASTALYGSRAANGVVMITTKTGRKDTPVQVNITSQYGVVTKGIDEYDVVNPGEYYELMFQSYKNSINSPDADEIAAATIFNRLGYNPFNVPNDQIVDSNGVLNPNAEVIFKGLNWYDELERTGSRMNHNINVAGGGENHNVFFSASYLDEEGYVIESDYNRVTSRLNADFQATDWLKIGGSNYLSITKQNGPSSRGSSIANPFGFAKNMAPIYPVYIVDPTSGDYILDDAGERQWDLGGGYPEYGIQQRAYGSSVGRHAIAEAILNSDQTKVNNLGYRYYVEAQLFEGLKAKITYGQDIQDYINKEYENNIVGDGEGANGRYSELRFRRTTENFNQILTYNKTFNDIHSLDVTLGHESFNRHYSEMDGMKNNQTVSGIYEFANFSEVANLDGYSSDKRTEGYFARVNYDYKDKYYLSGSARRDGSSVFSQDVRWGNFYSVGASWRIDQEDFMDNVSFVDRLKLRGSFGQVGNDNLNDFYISQPRYSILSNAGEPGIFWSDLGNNGLTWETVESWDIALEFALFQNRLEGSVEYYKKNSSDLLYNVPLPLSNGLSQGPENVGSMYNSGIEIGLTGHIIRNDNFTWDMTVQGSTLKNEITELPDPFVTGSKRWEVGRSRYDYYIYHYAGVDPSNGDALYYMYEDDGDGNQIPVLDAGGSHAVTNDYQDAQKAYVNESSIPDFLGSVSNSLTYKGFSLDFLFVYSLGGKILDYGYADMMHEGEYGLSLHPDMLNAWKQPGDITNVPRLENSDPNLSQAMSTRFLTDASYLALRNVNFGYTFENEFTDKIGLNNLRLYMVGENLFINTERTGLNPQYNLSGTPAGNDYNPSRVVSFGLNVSF